MPKARRLIEGATFDPADRKTLAAIVEEVWALIGAEYSLIEFESARARLATIALDLAKDGQLGPIEITRTAARLMRQELIDAQALEGPRV